jgi:hypothetical protein
VVAGPTRRAGDPPPRPTPSRRSATWTRPSSCQNPLSALAAFAEPAAAARVAEPRISDASRLPSSRARVRG